MASVNVNHKDQYAHLVSSLHQRIQSLLPGRVRNVTDPQARLATIFEEVSRFSLLIKSSDHPQTLGSYLQTITALYVTAIPNPVKGSLSELSAVVKAAFVHVFRTSFSKPTASIISTGKSSSSTGNQNEAKETQILPSILGTLLIAACAPPPKSSVQEDPFTDILMAFLQNIPLFPSSWHPAHYVSLADTVSISTHIRGTAPTLTLLSFLALQPFVPSPSSQPQSLSSFSLPCMAVYAGFCNALKPSKPDQSPAVQFVFLCSQALRFVYPLCTGRPPAPPYFAEKKYMDAVCVLLTIVSAGPSVVSKCLPSTMLNDLRQSLETLIIHYFTYVIPQIQPRLPTENISTSRVEREHQQQKHPQKETEQKAEEAEEEEEEEEEGYHKSKTQGKVQKTQTNLSETSSHINDKFATTATIVHEAFEVCKSRIATNHASVVQRMRATTSALSLVQNLTTNGITTPLKTMFVLTFVRLCSGDMSPLGNALFLDSLSYLHDENTLSSPPLPILPSLFSGAASTSATAAVESTLFRTTIMLVASRVARDLNAIQKLAEAAYAVLDIDAAHHSSDSSPNISRGLFLSQYIAQALVVRQKNAHLPFFLDDEYEEDDDSVQWSIRSSSTVKGKMETTTLSGETDSRRWNWNWKQDEKIKGEEEDIWLCLVRILLQECTKPFAHSRHVSQCLSLPIALIQLSPSESEHSIILQQGYIYAMTNCLLAITKCYTTKVGHFPTQNLISSSILLHPSVHTSESYQRQFLYGIVSVIDALAKHVRDRPLLTKCLSDFVDLFLTLSVKSTDDDQQESQNDDHQLHDQWQDQNRQHDAIICACLLRFMQLCHRSVIDIGMCCVERIVLEATPNRGHTLKQLICDAVLRMELGRKNVCLHWLLMQFNVDLNVGNLIGNNRHRAKL